ncbi:MAG: hypothetical protein ACRYGA_17210 [Janthinobacterium lividum]
MTTTDTPSLKPNGRLTKADTVSLWHAIENADLMAKHMHEIPGLTPKQIQREKDHVAQAKRALRKVNELRKAGL